PNWTGTVLVVYGDNVMHFSLQALLDQHRASGTVATIALFDTRIHAHSGIAGGKVIVGARQPKTGDRVLAFEEGPALVSSLVNTGVFALEPQVVSAIPAGAAPDFGKDVFPALLASGQHVAAHVIEPAGYCFGIDTPEALQRTREALRRI